MERGKSGGMNTLFEVDQFERELLSEGECERKTMDQKANVTESQWISNLDFTQGELLAKVEAHRLLLLVLHGKDC